MKNTFALPLILLSSSALWLTPAQADEHELPFEVANLFFELNNTDKDLGIQAEIDGEAWGILTIENPDEKLLLKLKTATKFRRQGLTELTFESAEPTFDEYPPEKFFQRFFEGTYEIEAYTLEGQWLKSDVEISHVMPAPASGIDISGVTGVWDEGCAEDEELIPEVTLPVVINWEPVTESHPTIGKMGEVNVEQYEVVLETETESEQEIVFSVELPPEVTELEIPDSFIELGEEFKFEILVRDENKNRTAMESCFVVADEEDGED